MADPQGMLSVAGESLGQAITEHTKAPPLRQNQNRAVWGTWLLVAGVYGTHDFVVRYNVDIGKLMAGFVRDPGGTASAVGTPFLIWCAMTLFGCLWVVVGVHHSRGPRQVMGIFWSLCSVGVCAYALVQGVYFDNDPSANWYLKCFYLATLAASLMALFLYARGTGSGNAQKAVRQQIAQNEINWRGVKPPLR